MNAKLRALLAKKQDEVNRARAISANAEKEGRDLSDSEKKVSDEHLAAITKINGDIEREQAILSAEDQLTVADLRASDPIVAMPRNHGFGSLGDFSTAVRRAGLGGVIDKRLDFSAAAPTTYGNEAGGADGGFLVPPEFASEIYTLMLEDQSFLDSVDDVPVSGNSMVFPKDETTPWGTDGVRAYWQNEAQSATQTKPKISPSMMRLHKLFGLVPVTDELLDDSTALDSYLRGKIAESINWKANDALVNGNGAGQPLGILNANNKALVVVAKEGSQSAGTLVANNVAKMFARMPAGSLGRAEWLINNDVLPQLLTMTLGNYPIYTPPSSGVVGAPAGLLFGRPIRITQHCQTIGTQGDIAFVDWKKYRTISKRNKKIQIDTSMHLYFDADATAFRAIFRLDGQPKQQSAITPNKGSSNLSPYVTLAAR